MKLRFLLALGVFIVAASGTAAGKAAVHKVTINGPGMSAPGSVEDRVVNRLTLATLDGVDRARTDRPRSTGTAYELAFHFAVADANGSRTEIIRQIFYPFAAGGPVVFTPRHTRIDWSFRPLRFDPGWFEVPGWVVRELLDVGMPDASRQPNPKAAAAPQLDPPSSKWPWFVGLAALTAAGAVAGARRRAT
jgi:hypothetical protein